MAHSLEFARKASVSDPAVPSTIGPEYRYPEIRVKFRRRASVLRINGGAFTGGTSPSLSFLLEQEVGGAWAALSSTHVVNASNPSIQEVVRLSPDATGVRFRVTAKTGAAPVPAIVDLDVNLVSP